MKRFILLSLLLSVVLSQPLWSSSLSASQKEELTQIVKELKSLSEEQEIIIQNSNKRNEELEKLSTQQQKQIEELTSSSESKQKIIEEQNKTIEELRDLSKEQKKSSILMWIEIIGAALAAFFGGFFIGHICF